MTNSSSAIGVRRASAVDAVTIQAIANRTWPIAYATMISPEQIAYMLERMYALDVLIHEMGGTHRYLIAEQEGHALGFVGLEHGFRGSPITRLHKLYVLPEAQGSGAGRLLLNSAILSAAGHGDTAIDLTVNRKNIAVGIYRKWGFRIVRDQVLDIGNGFVMDDHVMELELTRTKNWTK
jgi:GNAT superfamily N-acetyltransferase